MGKQEPWVCPGGGRGAPRYAGGQAAGFPDLYWSNCGRFHTRQPAGGQYKTSRHTIRHMDDSAIVAMLRAQNPAGLACAYDAYGRRLYAFCRALLRDSSTAEDVVQDTLLIAYQRAGQLRDPERFRPWLYALARNECLRQIRARRRMVALEEAGDVAGEPTDPGTRVHRRDLTRLVWRAAEGLNPRERAALELSVRHGLGGNDLADALGVTVNHAQTLLTRARQQLERGLTALLVGGTSAECAELASIVAGWDGQLTVLMRKRISRHVERCGQCRARKREEVNPTTLLAAAPLPIPPLDLRAQLLDRVTDPAQAAGREAIAERAGDLDPNGFPKPASDRVTMPTGTVAAAVVVLLLLLGLAGVMLTPVHQPSVGPAVDAPGAVTSSGTPTQTTGEPTVTDPATTAGAPGSGATPITAPSSSRSATAPTPTAPDHAPSARPVTGDLTFGANPLALGPLSEKETSVQATDGPVTWTAEPGPGVSITPSEATLASGDSTTAMVRLTDSSGSPGSADITFTLDDGTQQVLHVTWDRPID